MGVEAADWGNLVDRDYNLGAGLAETDQSHLHGVVWPDHHWWFTSLVSCDGAKVRWPGNTKWEELFMSFSKSNV